MSFVNSGLGKALFAGLATATLAACGGGGGTQDSTANGVDKPIDADTVVLTVTADRTTLPLNINGECATVGGPYTSTIYIKAMNKNGTPLTTGTVVSLVMVDDLPSGGIVFLDGDHTNDDTGCDTIYRNYSQSDFALTAGYATVHYHTDILNSTGYPISGTAKMQVSVVDPVTGAEDTEVIAIQVGGNSTYKPAQVVINYATDGYLYLQGMNDPTQMQIQVQVVDEDGQKVTDPVGYNNVRVRLLNAEGTGAYLQKGATTSTTEIRTASVNGQAQFTLHSGTATGTLLVEVTADRFDNNVDNGISDAVYNVATVPMVLSNPDQGEFGITAPTNTAMCRGQTNSVAFTASGGTLPYTWSLREGSLPSGLTFKSDGSFGGSTSVAAGTSFSLEVQARDSAFPTKAEDSVVTTFKIINPPTITSDVGSEKVALSGADGLGDAVYTSSNSDILVKEDGSLVLSSGVLCNQDISQPADGTLDNYVGSATITATFSGGCTTSAKVDLITTSCVNVLP